MHVSLTKTLEEYTKEKVRSGLYNNASEVIRESLRCMMQHEQNHANLRSSIARGFQQINEGNCTTISSREEFLNMVRDRDTE